MCVGAGIYENICTFLSVLLCTSNCFKKKKEQYAFVLKFFFNVDLFKSLC